MSARGRPSFVLGDQEVTPSPTVSGPGRGPQSAARCVPPQLRGSVSCRPKCLRPGPPCPSLSTATEQGPASWWGGRWGVCRAHSLGEAAFLWGPTTSAVSEPRPAPTLLWGCSPCGQRWLHPWPQPPGLSPAAAPVPASRIHCSLGPSPIHPVKQSPDRTRHPCARAAVSLPPGPVGDPAPNCTVSPLLRPQRPTLRQVWGAGCLQGKEI